MSLSSLFSSVFSVVHADAPEEKEEKKEEEEPAQEEAQSKEEPQSTEEPQEEAEEEEEEPQDPLDGLQEACAGTAKCQPFAKHFEHCETKVNAGEGFKHEDCVEEFLMHCVNGCVAPKLFATLK